MKGLYTPQHISLAQNDYLYIKMCSRKNFNTKCINIFLTNRVICSTVMVKIKTLHKNTLPLSGHPVHAPQHISFAQNGMLKNNN